MPFFFVALAATLLVAAPVVGQEVRTLTVDASEQGAYVALGEQARVIAVEDPTASAEWDLAFVGTTLLVNGGEGGSAGVTAHCVCQNADATNEALQAMTPDSELEDFTSVTADRVPRDDAAWHPAAIAAAPWYRYNIAMQHLIWPTYDVYLIRRGEEIYKVQVTGYYGADGTPRQVTFRYGKV